VDPVLAVLRGTAANADAEAMGNRFSRVADIAWEQIETRLD